MKNIKLHVFLLCLGAFGAIQAKKIKVRNCTDWIAKIDNKDIKNSKKCTAKASTQVVEVEGTCSIQVFDKEGHLISVTLTPIQGVKNIMITGGMTDSKHGDTDCKDGVCVAKSLPKMIHSEFPIIRINEDPEYFNEDFE